MGLQLTSLLRQTGTIRLGLQSLLIASLLALPSTALMSRAAELEGGFEIVQLSDMNWDEGSERVQQRILYGDPAEEGFYIIRLRFPAGATSRPHFHSTDRFITVIEGTWNAGDRCESRHDGHHANSRGRLYAASSGRSALRRFEGRAGGCRNPGFRACSHYKRRHRAVIAESQRPGQKCCENSAVLPACSLDLEAANLYSTPLL